MGYYHSTHRQHQKREKSNGIQFDLDKDSVQVPCTECPERTHTIFHCPVLGLQCLIVVDPIIPEVFVYEGALDTSLTVEDVRKTIASECHMLPTKIVLTSKFLEPLDDGIKLKAFAQMESIGTKFAKVLYALESHMAESVRRELTRNPGLSASLTESDRALALLPQFMEDLLKPPGSLVDVGSSPTVNLTKAALLHALTEIECVLPEVMPKPDEIVSLINSIQSKIDQIDQPVTLKALLNPKANPWIPSNSPSPSTHTISKKQPPHNALIADPSVVHSQRSYPSDPLGSEQPSLSIPPSNFAAATGPVLSHDELIASLSRCDGFEKSYNFNALLVNPLRLITAALHPLSILLAKRQKVLIQAVRYQLKHGATPYEKEVATYILILFQLFQVVKDQGKRPFTSDQWSELQQLVLAWTPSAPNCMFRRATLRNLVGLPLEDEVTASFDAKTGFSRFIVLADLVVSFGLKGSSKDWIEYALDALDKGKRVGTKHSVRIDAKQVTMQE